ERFQNRVRRLPDFAVEPEPALGIDVVAPLAAEKGDKGSSDFPMRVTGRNRTASISSCRRCRCATITSVATAFRSRPISSAVGGFDGWGTEHLICQFAIQLLGAFREAKFARSEPIQEFLPDAAVGEAIPPLLEPADAALRRRQPAIAVAYGLPACPWPYDV